MGLLGDFGPSSITRWWITGLIRGPKVPILAKITSLTIFGSISPRMTKIRTCGPLIRPIIPQWVMLEGPKSPKSPHKLVLTENVSIRSMVKISVTLFELHFFAFFTLLFIKSAILVKPSWSFRSTMIWAAFIMSVI